MTEVHLIWFKLNNKRKDSVLQYKTFKRNSQQHEIYQKDRHFVSLRNSPWKNILPALDVVDQSNKQQT